MRRDGGALIRFLEGFSEDVKALVVFIFKGGSPEEVEDILRTVNAVSECFEVIPYGVRTRGAGVITDDFGDDGFPPVRAAVNANDGRGEVEVNDRRLVRFEGDF